MSESIVLFGGTFDPVHHGHLIVARAVAERCGFDKVLFVPAASPPHKEGAHVTGAGRLEMLQLALEGEDLLETWDVELRRSGASYTFDTVMEARKFQGRDVKINLIFGADMLADLHEWHRIDELIDAARPIVPVRHPWRGGELQEVLSRLADRLGGDRAGRIAEGVLETPLIDISSSDIRRRIEQGLSIRYLVPESVRKLILRKGFYGA